ncbi:MAG: glycosyltransferase [Kiritimatiellae bacterium]|nr:glycosyltransferase [Kiritimatiellia bacterium]
MKDIARADIKPAFVERNVPVALATDENYLPYLKVAINSAIARSPGSNLDIIVLHADIPEGAILDFTAGYAGVSNASVRFFDISDELETSGLSDYKQTARLPLSSCYRLLLPRILPAFDKVVYIDVDVAVCRDLGELYSTDVGGCWFAAAKDVVYNTKPEYVSWAEKWGFAEWNGYVNTGVLVMNLERFRSEPVLDRLKEIIFEAAKWNCDQDALNFVCKGAIAPLDPRWNVQLGDYCLKEQLDLTGGEIWVAHFTGGQKPWSLPVRQYSHLWWRHIDDADIARFWSQAWGGALVSSVGGKPKISIVMPVYNADKYLSEALASVLMQRELPEIELICVDDGSTDDSSAILKLWKGRDSRLHVLNQTNQGPGVARNAGMDVAKGEYICFLDADDTIASGAALQQAYSQATVDKLDILLADSSNMSETGTVTLFNAGFVRELLPKASVFKPDALGAGLYIVSQGAPWAKLFRRGFLAAKNFRFPPLKRTEDLPFVQMALSIACRIGVMLVPIVNHRMGVSTSLESTKDDTPLIFAEAERIFRSSLSRRRLLGRFRRAADVSHLVNIAYCLHMVRRFSSFRAIARYCAEKFPELNLKGDEVGIRSFYGSFKRVSSVVEAVNDADSLAEIFAEVQASKRLRSLRDLSKEELAAKEAALKQLRGEIMQLCDNAAKQSEAIKAKDAALEQLRGVTAQLKGGIEKQRKAITAKDMALGQLRNVVTQLKRDAEKRREVIVAKNRSIAEQSAAITSLRRGIDGKQRLIDKYERIIGKLKGAIDL